MCLISFAINASERWPLVVASNRDEFFDRPSTPLEWWTTGAGHRVLSGRDLRAGGTWLGMTPGGRIAWLTNVRQANMPPSPKSRGELVMQWLEGEMDAAHFMSMTDPFAFGGFNLVLGNAQTNDWTWLSNRIFDAAADDFRRHRAPEKGWCARTFGPGVYGLSNAALDTPWPKTVALKASLGSALAAADETGDVERLTAPLWQALANQELAANHALPDSGLPLALEQTLSSAFINDRARAYGTRCSTLLVASNTRASGAEVWGLKVEEKTFLRTPDAGVDYPDVLVSSSVSEALQWQCASPGNQRRALPELS